MDLCALHNIQTSEKVHCKAASTHEVRIPLHISRYSAVSDDYSHNIGEPAEDDWIDRTTSVCVPDPVFIICRKKGQNFLQDHTIYPDRVQVVVDVE